MAGAAATCGPRHICGMVYWNCCSTAGCAMPHLVQLKWPYSSSGFTWRVEVQVDGVAAQNGLLA